MPCYIQPSAPASKAEFAQWQEMGYNGTWDQYVAAKRRLEGGTMFVCGDLGDACADCPAVGDFLCDFPVSPGKTCDRPMCGSHSHEIGPELHYCEIHYEMWRTFRDGGGVDEALRNVVAYKAEK